MKYVRIGAGAGYAGDRIEPALDIIQRGNVDYLIFECLAERTIALSQKDKLENPAKGYNPLLTYRMNKILPLIKKHPVKIITNMGAANPLAAAQRIFELACDHEMPHLKIAAVIGDDILHTLDQYYDSPVMESGDALATLSASIISANAYIGGECISKALAEGADIVITGRVADPALVTGPIMHELNGRYDDYDLLGKTIAAGHLLECGGQATGGYFADPGYKDVPDLWNLGFPILEFSADGSMHLEKLHGSGGILNEATIKEQLLYEIQDPAAYLTPDVVADFSNITISDQLNGTVAIANARGRQKTGMLKVSVGYENGYIGEGEISYGGHNAVQRAMLAAEVIRKRLQLIQLQCHELRVDLMGVNSLYGDAIQTGHDPVEVRLRVAARVATDTEANAVGQEVEALYTNGPAGGGGYSGYTRKVISVASVLVPESAVNLEISWKGGVTA